ncbi:MAG: glycosyltransferase [Nanoarchaeota archaeon]
MSYLWFNYSRLLIQKIEIKEPQIKNTSYSVIVPCYNEEPRLLIESVKSLINTDDLKKEILIVDDGSQNNIWETIIELKKSYPKLIKIYKQEKNMGKRFAHKIGIKNAKYDFVISIDSDTIVEKNSIKNLLAPFQDENVGATTGNVLIKNENYNWLTRVQAGLYWLGLNVYKKGQSTQGNVVCCSGCLSAYRKSDLIKILDEYVYQTFGGQKCHASEDRYLTNLINEMGKKILYVESAICYTEAPVTLKKFIRQQIRWKRGFFRECLYMTTFAYKKSKMLYFENLVWMLMTPLITMPLVLSTYFFIIFTPINFVLYSMPNLILFIVCRDSLFFIEEPKKAFFYLPYIVLYLFILYPLNIYALFTLKDSSWMTR